MKRLFVLALPLAASIVIGGCSSNTPPLPDASQVSQVSTGDQNATDQNATDQNATDQNVIGQTVADRTTAAGQEATSAASSGPVSSGPVTSGTVTVLADVTVPAEGYLLIAPLRSTETYLINGDKQVVHSWKSKYSPAASVYLMENGDLLHTGRDPDFKHFFGGGVGGILERFSWDGQLLWTFTYADETHCAHHDIAPLPNGNILMTAWERKSKEEAIAQGRDPNLLKDDLWPDHVIEVQPDATGGKIVWEWHMWDHLVQDFDREKPNYGIIYEHPELIDLNNIGSTPPATPEELRKLRAVGYAGGGDDDKQRRTGADWMHTNAIDYNAELDQIALSAKNFSEIWIIDHSTTREEAASHHGGKHGKGGDLLYRWGNPWAYKSGTLADKKLFDQHDVRWIPPGLPGAGNLMAFNNGQGREYSSIIEIKPPLDEGEYVLDDEGRYGPQNLEWEYVAENKKDFYSSFISGATRMPNGNTLICEGATGRIFEVNREGKTVWQHFNTFGGELTMDARPNDPEKEARRLLDAKEKKPFVENTALFRATKYPPNYAGLAGKNLEPLAEQPIPFADLVKLAVARLEAESKATASPTEEGDDKKPSDAEKPSAGAADAAGLPADAAKAETD